MKEAAIGFGIGLLITLALYFFWHVPEVDKAYNRGLAQCKADKDTVYVPGKDSTVYRDTSFSSQEPAIIVDDDLYLAVETSFDTTYVSGRDTISIDAFVSIKNNSIADWLVNIQHRDFEQQPDTLKVYDHIKEIVIEKETNWLLVLIGTVGGALAALALFLAGG